MRTAVGFLVLEFLPCIVIECIPKSKSNNNLIGCNSNLITLVHSHNLCIIDYLGEGPDELNSRVGGRWWRSCIGLIKYLFSLSMFEEFTVIQRDNPGLY